MFLMIFLMLRTRGAEIDLKIDATNVTCLGLISLALG